MRRDVKLFSRAADIYKAQDSNKAQDSKKS